jgi:zinc protease
LQRSIDAELHRLMTEGPTAREMEQAQNSIESDFLNGLEQISSKADRLDSYFYFTGTPNYFQQDLARYHAVTAQDIQRVARQYLGAHRVVLSVVPQGKTEMAVTAAEATP